MTGGIVQIVREDCQSACDAAGSNGDIYRHLASAAESGWDFSSRWLENPMDLSSIRTTRVRDKAISVNVLKVVKSGSSVCEWCNIYSDSWNENVGRNCFSRLRISDQTHFPSIIYSSEYQKPATHCKTYQLFT